MKPKQAIILIHGIGEQRPSETLRSFVKCVSPSGRYYNKYDLISTISELRRLQLVGDKHTPPTDCYELYWAHNIQDKTTPILRWMTKFLLTKYKSSQGNFNRHLLLTRIFILVAISITLTFSLTEHSGVAQKILSVFSPLVLAYILAKYMYNYLGKASAYLNPAPENIENRKRIRDEGVDLLTKLHASKKYFRIVLVGHSLGSVIGYDILRHYWAGISPGKDLPALRSAPVKRFTADIAVLDDQSRPPGERIEFFQQAQHALWRELRDCKFPWLVTDFITLGSPLAHSPALLSETPEQFEERKKEREYPECPPCDWRNRKFFFDVHLPNESPPRNIKHPERDCPFICTRWTNIFFHSEKLLHGDIVAGPLQMHFGAGIKDIPIQADAFATTCHAGYWSALGSLTRPFDTARTKLVSALKLEAWLAKQEWPAP